MIRTIILLSLFNIFSCSNLPGTGIDLTLKVPVKKNKVSLQNIEKNNTEDEDENSPSHKNIILYLPPFLQSQESALTFSECLKKSNIAISAYSGNGDGTTIALLLANGFDFSKIEWFLRKNRHIINMPRLRTIQLMNVIPENIEELKQIFIFPISQKDGNIKPYYSGKIEELLYLDTGLVTGGGEQNSTKNFNLPRYLFKRVSNNLIVIPRWNINNPPQGFTKYSKIILDNSRDDIISIPWDNGLNYYYNDMDQFQNYCKEAILLINNRLK